MKKLTKKQLDMISALKNKTLGNVSKACSMVGISRQAHYQWLDKVDTYKKAYDDVIEDTKDFVETALLVNIKNGNVAAQIFWLKTRCKDRGYVEKIEVEHDDRKITHIVRLPDNGR